MNEVPESRRILVVEDERLIRMMLRRALEAHGYEVEEAEDGQIGLEKIEAWRPDVVLLDLMMPRVDGLEVLRRVRAAPETEALPVVVLSARASPEALEEALNSGADDFIRKPFQLSEVIARVETNLRVLNYRVQLDAQVEAQRRLVHTLGETTDFLQSLIDATPNAVIAVAPDGEIKVFNRAAQVLFGLNVETVVGVRPLDDLFALGEGARLLEILKSEAHGGAGRIVPPEHTIILDADGAQIPVSVSASSADQGAVHHATLLVIQDRRPRLAIEHELTETQAQLQKKVRMAALAELAGATAHELNQPLTTVMGYADLLERQIGPDNPGHRALGRIQDAAARMADIVRAIGRITRYETRSYVGEARILDLSAASAERSPADKTPAPDKMPDKTADKTKGEG